jgi:hypothetical protein
VQRVGDALAGWSIVAAVNTMREPVASSQPIANGSWRVRTRVGARVDRDRARAVLGDQRG